MHSRQCTHTHTQIYMLSSQGGLGSKAWAPTHSIPGMQRRHSTGSQDRTPGSLAPRRQIGPLASLLQMLLGHPTPTRLDLCANLLGCRKRACLPATSCRPAGSPAALAGPTPTPPAPALSEHQHTNKQQHTSELTSQATTWYHPSRKPQSSGCLAAQHHPTSSTQLLLLDGLAVAGGPHSRCSCCCCCWRCW